MNTSLSRLILPTALLGGWLIQSPSAQGSNRAFNDYLAHQHAETTTLPDLNGFIPTHVPVFTNEGAIRFWETNQESPILKNAAFEIQLCEAVTARRDLNPSNFDHYHPLLGRLLSNPQFFDYALHLYNTHPSRFVFYHHHVIPVIRGCAMMMMNTPTTPTPTGVSPVVIQAPGSTTVTPVPAEISNSPGPIAGPSPVPGPPSIVLMIVGIGYLAARLRRPHIQPAL